MPSYAKPRPTTAAVESTLANRPSLNANRRRQDLSGVKDGMIEGRGGRKQVLGPAAQQRLAAGALEAAAPPAPAKPAWQQLREAGMAGTGSAAGNRAAAAGLPGAGPAVPPGPGGPMTSGGPYRNPNLGGDAFAGRSYGDRGGSVEGAGGPVAVAGSALPAEIQAARAAAPMNPQFSANLPPEIMQRLVALRSGAGGMPPGVAGALPGAIKPGMGGPGAPPTFADYWSGPDVAPYGGGAGGWLPAGSAGRQGNGNPYAY